MRLIGGLALDAWGIPRATKDAGFAVPVGAAEKAADSLRGPATEVRPLRIGGVGVRDSQRGLRIALVDRRFHFAGLFQEAIRDARASGRTARVGGYDVSLVSLEFLLAMKLVSGEPQDEVDARRILQRQELRYADAREIVEHHLGAASANRLDALAREVLSATFSNRSPARQACGIVTYSPGSPASRKDRFPVVRPLNELHP